MTDNESGEEFGSFCTCIIGAIVWAFLSSNPSPAAWILLALFTSYAILGYLFWMLHLEEGIFANGIKIQPERISASQLEGTYSATPRLMHGGEEI
jgi:hypothetical protein